MDKCTDDVMEKKQCMLLQEFIIKRLRKALTQRACSIEDEDANVYTEENHMRILCKEYISESLPEDTPDYAIQMHGLRKEYGLDPCFPWLRSKKTIALHGNWFGVKRGT